MILDIECDLTYRNRDEIQDRELAISVASAILGDKAELAWGAWMRVSSYGPDEKIVWEDGFEPTPEDAELAHLWGLARDKAEEAYFESWAMWPQTGGVTLYMA